MAYSKSDEWLGGKMIKISSFVLHKDMIFSEFENIIASGGSVIGGFPLGPEFRNLEPDDIYEFTPPGTKRKPIGSHMVQFIGTGAHLGREFLVFLNSKKRFGKDGVGKVYFDQIYKGVYTLQCLAPPPPPSDDLGLIVAGLDDNNDTVGSSGGAASDGNNMLSFSGGPDGNNSSSFASSKSLSQVGKCNKYNDNPISSSCCAIKMEGWVPSAPALLVEDIQTRICPSTVMIERMPKQFKDNLPPAPEFLFCVATERKNCNIYGPWKKKNPDEMGTVTQCFVPSNKMNDLQFTNILLKIYDKLGALNSKLALEHRQIIPVISKITTLILGRDLSHISSGLSDILPSAGVSENQHGRKHNQPISSSGPANSAGTMNTTGPFPSLASSTPLRNTIPMQSMHHNGSVLSSLVVFGADATGAKESPTDQIVDMDHFLDDDWLGHKVDWFLSQENGMLFHATSPDPNIPNWSTDGVISPAKIEDIEAKEKRHRERRKGLLKSQADSTSKQKEHQMASQIYCLAISREQCAALYSTRSLCKLLIGNGEGALSDALGLWPDWAKACYRQAAALMPLKDNEQARYALLDAQKLDPGNAGIESEIGKARKLIKNPIVEGAY